MSTCTKCGGGGRWGGDDCPRCEGTGRSWEAAVSGAVFEQAFAESHPASVSEGQPSVLRTSAPEGIDDLRAKLAEALSRARCAKCDGTGTVQHEGGNGVHTDPAPCLFCPAGEFLADLEVARDQLRAAQAQARTPSAASAASAPEGQDTRCTICTGDASSLGSWVDVRMGYQHTGSETRYGNRLVCRDCRERIIEAIRFRWSATPASVSEGPSRGAPAPLAPEGKLAVYRENGDCFIVRARDISTAEEERHHLRLVLVVANDPRHLKQWQAGEEFECMVSKVIPGASAYGNHWTLVPIPAQLTPEGIDALDLMRDEFLRIRALAVADGEIAGLCDRAIAKIHQRVPVIVQRDDAIRERDALARFKAYVHERLDQAGVPVDPPSEHREKGCRIGGRLDWIIRRALHPLMVAAPGLAEAGPVIASATVYRDDNVCGVCGAPWGSRHSETCRNVPVAKGGA